MAAYLHAALGDPGHVFPDLGGTRALLQLTAARTPGVEPGLCQD